MRGSNGTRFYYKIEERDVLKANLAHILVDTGFLTDRWSLVEKSFISLLSKSPPQLIMILEKMMSFTL